ncbi:hypothetical protein KIW84_051207 [Lathyrus oleraceus]|uniref:Transcription termination and cleavage factor C-terminal domain-containing protein n=2 Tax=Pisum sativum TaxID=3888 RepID=A0A9D4WJN7_PEA|nr:hypothetical protein KIW84_051207 [Pisum sativum]
MKFTPADMQTKTNSANKNTNLYPAELALHSSITKYPNHMIKHASCHHSPAAAKSKLEFHKPGTGQNNLMLPSARSPTLGSLSIRPLIQLVNSTAMNQQMHASFLQHPVRAGSSTVSHNLQMVRPDASFQADPSMSSSTSKLLSKEGDRSSKAPEDWTKNSSNYSNMFAGLENIGTTRDIPESFTRPLKLTRLNDERKSSLASGTSDVPVSKGSSYVLGSSLLPAPAVPKAEARHPDQQSSQLPSDVEFVLLQQVLNLTPEQLSSLPPEQQQ